MADKKFVSIEVERHPEATIVLPETMQLRDGAKWLISLDEEQNEPYAIYDKTSAHPLDGAYALARAVARIFGNARSVAIPGMFGSTPPVFIDVPLDSEGTSVKVPWGRIILPGISKDDGYLQAGIDYDRGRPVFVLTGKMLKKHKKVVDDLATEMRRVLHEESIYKSKAIRVSEFTVDPKEMDGNPTHFAPTFINVSGLTMQNVILNADVEKQITDYVLTPLRYPASAAKVGVPRKRGVLLHGTFGVGKSLTSRVIAHEATTRGWTFIYIDKAEHLTAAYRMAMDYQPAVLFVEDVDKVASGERDASMDEVLNILDGIETKRAEVMTVFTTNELHSIHRAFERPGRIDVIIEITEPDALAAARLVRLYAGEMIPEDTDLTEVGEALKGSVPALIEEAVNRAKLSGLHRSGGDPKHLMITPEDVVLASRSLDNARALLHRTPPADSTVHERVGRDVMEAVASAGGLRVTVGGHGENGHSEE